MPVEFKHTIFECFDQARNKEEKNREKKEGGKIGIYGYASRLNFLFAPVHSSSKPSHPHNKEKK